MRFLAAFPRSWVADVIVLRGGGRDSKGNPLPSQEIPRKGVLIGARSTSDPVDHSDVVDNKAVLYDDDTTFKYHASDIIRVPESSRMSGSWMVDGRPAEWPYGWEVGLVPA